MSTKKVLLFAPAVYNLAETSRTIEVAKGVRANPAANAAFDIQFLSEGGAFEHLILESGFSFTTIDPPISNEKIEHIMAVDREEKIASAFSKKEIIEKVNVDIKYLKSFNPVAVVTGSYTSIPLACRVLNIPLVWNVQTTWLPSFFASGAGMTDGIKTRLLKKIADTFICHLVKFWMWYGIVRAVNRAAKHFGVEGFSPVFSYYEGQLNLVAEPKEFSNVEVPETYFFTGPLLTNQNFSLPDKVTSLPHDLPIIYFAMGSTGVSRIIVKIIESFKGKPYRVIAPVKRLLDEGVEVEIPENVIVTDWLPALEVNRMADIAVIHGGIGTVLTAAMAGKPVVGVGMQPEQVANLGCLVRKGFAIRVPKSKNVGEKVQEALRELLQDEEAHLKANLFSTITKQYDGPKLSAEVLYEHYGK